MNLIFKRDPSRSFGGLALPLVLALLASACTTLPAPPEPPVVAAPTPPALPVPAPEPEPAPAPPMVAPALEPEPAPPLPTRSQLDDEQDNASVDLWQRLRDGYSIPELQDERVAKWEQYYAGQPDYMQRMATRGGRYLFHIVEEVQKRDMPIELALLPFIESAFNPQAMSRAKASGMWQFMPGTGKDYDLRQNLFRDDRRDVLASTRAALDYLQRLYKMFDDWQLALAAYNWGQGNVLREVRRNQRAGKPTDYASLRMPNETRNYVPKFQAMKNIVARPEAYALSLPPLVNHPYFLSVPIERDIDVKLAAELAGLPLEEFLHLNPQLNKPVILAAGTPQVLLPYDNANQFVRDLALARPPLASWTAWVAPRTLKTAEAARAVGMSEADLREVNQIPERMLVKVGSTLLVPRAPGSNTDVAEHIADGGQLSLASEARPVRMKQLKAGRKGDSVAAVAKRHGLNPALVAQWNGVSLKASFKPGQLIKLQLPPAPARKLAAQSTVQAKAKTAVTPKARVVRKAQRKPTRVAQR